jgi:TonB family protein
VAVALGGIVVVLGSFYPIAPPSAAGADGKGSEQELDGLADADLKVVMRFESRSTEQVLEALAAVAPLELRWEGEPLQLPITVDIDGTLREALLEVARQSGIGYRVAAPDTLVVLTPVMPKLIHKVDPAYPNSMRDARREGKVALEATILSDGSIGDVSVLRGEEGAPEFAESAVEAVRQWRYSAPLLDGRPTSVKMNMMIMFSLREKQSPDPPGV